ncbi:MAG: tyrosine-type recombinase/integrase [Cypionkella sp.]
MTFVGEPRPVRPVRMKAGELAEPIATFAAHLSGLGYTPLTIAGYTDAARHLGAWLALSGLDVSTLSEPVFERFAEHQCRCGGSRASDRLSPKYVRRVRRFVQYLGECGVIPVAAPTPVLVDPLVARFGEWLRRHRGLTERTIARHVRMISRLLPALGDDPRTCDAFRVRAVILDEGRRCSAAYVKTMAMALRGYLRFLAAHGECRPGLDHAVPPTPGWRLSALPRYLPSEDVTRLIESCDLSLPHGIRDRAILLLLARLGLRAHDVWAMEIADIDWAAGMVRVRGKRRREVRLPLPQEVGDALLAYLERVRPPIDEPKVFLRSVAPYTAFANSNMASTIVRSALRRAGIINAPSQGAHLLRHSAATAMLRSGATLDAIGAILRHESPDTTAHYAKVDVATLRLIAQPWPGDE